MGKKYVFTLSIAVELLGGIPNKQELLRLREHYKTFEWNYRSSLLYGFFDGMTVDELTDEKLDLKNVELPISGKQRGGHSRWVVTKPKKYVLRILYLRYRIDQGLNQIEANQLVAKAFSTSDKNDTTQSNIRKATHCKLLGDKEISK